MSKRLGLVLAMIVALMGAARADWTSATGIDPMTDRKWVEAYADFSAPGTRGIILKCWTGGSVQVAIMTGRYADDDHSKEPVEVSFRVDTGSPIKVRLTPSVLNGNRILSANVRNEPGVLSVVKAIGRAKARVATAFTSAVYQTPASGAHNAIRRMAEVCSHPALIEADAEMTK